MNTQHQSLRDSILEIDNEWDGIEPTNSQLQQVVVPNDKLEMAWCGGSPKRGCGNKINLFAVKTDTYGYIICPKCGRRNQ